MSVFPFASWVYDGAAGWRATASADHPETPPAIGFRMFDPLHPLLVPGLRPYSPLANRASWPWQRRIVSSSTSESVRRCSSRSWAVFSSLIWPVMRFSDSGSAPPGSDGGTGSGWFRSRSKDLRWYPVSSSYSSWSLRFPAALSPHSADGLPPGPGDDVGDHCRLPRPAASSGHRWFDASTPDLIS